MQTFETWNKIYALDDDGFLVNPLQWDEDFAEEMAPRLGIGEGLTPLHWNVVKFIRATFLETGSCPAAYKTCGALGLSLRELEKLFPAGYRRGACRLAGVSLMHEGAYAGLETEIKRGPLAEREYRVNAQGFLIDRREWDEDYAAFKARELQTPGGLGEKHWRMIRYLRSEFEKRGEIPTLYEACAAAGIDIDEFAELFPSGYHRGAVKIAGLRLSAKARGDAPVEAASGRSGG